MTPKALLSGFIQIRIYEMQDGLDEDSVRRDIADYLTEHKLLRATREQAAS